MGDGEQKGMSEVQSKAELSQAKQALLKKRLGKLRVPGGASKQIIAKADYQDSAPLSSGQRRLWYLNQLEPNSGAYNIPLIYQLSGELNKGALEQALQVLVTRHESLRTEIVSGDSSTVQHILPSVEVTLNSIDLTEVAAQERQAVAAEELASLAEKPFVLEKGPLWHFSLIELQAGQNILCMVFYHAIFDGWSADIFMRELALLYPSLVSESEAGLADVALQYADFAVWQQNSPKSSPAEEDLQYWTEHLSGQLPVLQVPTDYPRPQAQSFEGAALSYTISREKVERLTELGRTEGATLFMVLLSVYAFLLYRYSDQDDLIIGTPVAGRSLPELENIIGFFANTLAIRIDLDSKLSFRELLRQVKEICIEAYGHQNITFERLVEELKPPRDLSRTPLFQTMFAFRNQVGETQTLGDLGLSTLPAEVRVAQTDMSLWLEQRESGISVIFEYCTALFRQSTIQRMLDHFALLLDCVLETPDQNINAFALIGEEEMKSFGQWNSTEKNYPQKILFSSYLSQQSAARVEQTAVVCGELSLNYGELEAQSNQLAHYLRSIGVDRGHLVGIAISRSVDMLVGLLGIWKAGAAYVPLDPEYPSERLLYMLEASGLEVLVTETALLDVVAGFQCQHVCLDRDAELISSQAASLPSVSLEPDDIAYVIFTSGSTGKPKGVKVPHGAVNNFLHGMAEKPGLTVQDRLLAVTTLSFDIAVLELYLPLLVGATTVIANKEAVTDGTALSELISRHNVTVMQATPSTWRLLNLSGWQGSDQFKVLCGGEAFPRDLAADLLERAAEVWNMYGPTETTVWSTCYRISSADVPVLIGRPIANTQCYVLDEAMQQVPIGVPGELYIGGDGVTAGYLNREDLTSERFVADPQQPDRTLYRTGDLVRWCEDGYLEYFHRIDNQVKVRGFRIELGEIEAVLNKHVAIKESVVVVWEGRPGDQRLVAYVVLAESCEMTVTEMRSHLRQHLPDYMVPQLFVELEEIPQTPNGKVDRKALPETMPGLGQQEEVTPPTTETEKTIAGIWAALLQTENIGVDDNFFDIGGHSLLAMELIYKIHEECGVRVSPLDILVNTLEQISAMVGPQGEAGAEHLEVAAGLEKPAGLISRFLSWSGKK